MRILIASLGLALLVGACQTSPSPPATKAQPTATQPAAAPKTQTVVVRHVAVTPATHPNAKGSTARVAAVGQVAPDFTLPAYHQGKFTQVKLSSLRGKWVLLCFYPGDFTFV